VGWGGELIIYLKGLKSCSVLPKKYLLNKQYVFWSHHHASYDEKDRIISYIRSNEQINMTYSADDSFVKKQNTVTNVQTSYYISPLNPLQKVEIVTPTQTKTITYLTDGELKRSAKLVNGIIKNYYLYDKQGRLVAELNPDQTLKSRFIYDANNHSPDLMIDIASGERYNFIKDQLGSILSVLTQNNQSKQQLRYDVFGAVTQDTNPGFQPFGFAGGHYDFETGLVRFGARDYDADTARWLVRDPIRFAGGDSNLYGYCGNDFVNCVDPSGLFVPYSLTANDGGGGGSGGVAGGGGGIAAAAAAAIEALINGFENSISIPTDDFEDSVDSQNSDIEKEPCPYSDKGGHKKNKRKSNKEKHEDGERRRGKDKGGEKGDERRPYRRK
jgi:RHS repeat-associated protein